MGAESIALFARVGGGIYTKQQMLGQTLLGKLKKAFRKMIHVEILPLPTNVGDNVEMLQVWEDLLVLCSYRFTFAMVLGNYVIRDMGGDITKDSFKGWGPFYCLYSWHVSD